MFNVIDFLLQFLNLVDKFSGFEVVGGGAVDREGFKLVLPDLNFILFLVDELGQSLVLTQQLVIVLHNEFGLIFELIHLLSLLLQDVHLLHKTVVLPF
jgi:hypothetical protein